MTKPCGSGDTVNVATVQRKFMSLSGEACLPCGSRLLSVNVPVEGVTGDPMPGISRVLPPGHEIRNYWQQADSRCCSAFRGNPEGEKAGVSRGHSSPTPGVMPRTW